MRRVLALLEGDSSTDSSAKTNLTDGESDKESLIKKAETNNNDHCSIY